MLIALRAASMNRLDGVGCTASMMGRVLPFLLLLLLLGICFRGRPLKQPLSWTGLPAVALAKAGGRGKGG